ncbi:N-acetylglucosamine kinase [Orbaceae bacterium ac157xtp]
MLYGFDIGGTKIEIGVFDEYLNQIWSKRIATPKESYNAFLTAIVELVLEADKKFSTKGMVGIGIPGMINHKEQTIYTTNIEMVKNKPFIADLTQAIGRNIAVENDANCFVLSESYHDDFKTSKNVLGIILGTGLGGGLVINHKIVAGNNGCGGEIGHIRMPIDMFDILGRDTPIIPCGCGLKGCCERYLSGTGFEWLYHHKYHQNLKAKTIIEHFYQGEPKAIEHTERYLDALSAYLGNLLMVLDAELVVFGGGLSNFEQIYQELPKRLPSYILKQMQLPRIEKARYGDSGGTRGAALLNIKK